ncbi:MAG: hypothetical protein [Caudoviricetes sp.]|nr:MAG: hypothetical protein [Caudoviricetes sp.]
MKIKTLKLRPECVEKFKESGTINYCMYNYFGTRNFDVVYYRGAGSVLYKWRIEENLERDGWYLTDYEIEKYFEEVKTESNEKVKTESIERAVILNDLTVTRRNMEEVFEHIRKMLN